MKKLLLVVMAVIFSLTAMAEWNFRGTPNSWASEAMTYNSNTGLYETTQTFGTGDSGGGPRFKIDRYGDWTESYPTGDYTVNSNTTYDITVNPSTHEIIATEAGQVETWYFRGTPNSWGLTLMNYNETTGLYETTQTFGTGDSGGGPRFKIDDGNWTETYPTADYTVTENTTYLITFNSSTNVVNAVAGGTAPTVSANTASGNFTNSLTVTLSVSGDSLTACAYTLDGTDPSTSATAVDYANGDTVTVGSAMNINDSVTLTLYAANSEGSDTASYTYTKIEEATGLKIYYKSSSTPTIWTWEGDGSGGTGNQAISELMGYTWPGANMTLAETNWYMFEIPADYLPLTGALKVIFNGGSELTTNASATWYDGTAWYASNPDNTSPTVSATPGTKSFTTDTLTISLALSGDGVTASKYTLDGTDPSTSATAVDYLNGDTVTIGSAMNVNDSVTLNMYAVNAEGSDTASYTYTKTETAGVAIYYKSSSAPTIWTWEGDGTGGTGNQAISELMGATWPGDSMTLYQDDWYIFEIPSEYLPITGALSVIFDGGSTQIVDLSKPWYDGTTWYKENPDQPQAPSIELNIDPSQAILGTKTVIVTVTAQNATVDNKTASFNGEALTFNGDEASFVLGNYIADLQTGTLIVSASNSLGTTTITENITRDDSNVVNFTWDNALVYFVMTDRFYNADTSNDESYGRTKNYGGSLSDSINTATFHGGDIPGLTAKLNEGYFENLGVNAIWITAPYEQAHGFVGGGWSNGAATYPHYAYHGYYTLDWTEMDKNMGTVEEFRTFVRTAHSQGIRVVMDIVMNHTGYETITDAAEYGFGGVNLSLDAARSWRPSDGNWGSFDSYYAGTYDSSWNNWWGSAWVRSKYYGTGGSDDLTKCLDFLPDVKTEEGNNVGLAPLLQTKWARETSGFDNWIVPAASGLRQNLGIAPTQYQEKWLAAWVEEFGIDGFRCDTAKHVNLYRWNELKEASKIALNNWRASSRSDGDDAKNWTDDFWMTGEVWGHGVGRSEYFDNGFDSVINFTFPKGNDTYSIGDTWAYYASAINSDPTFNVLSYLNSHDARDQYGWVTTDINSGTCLVLAPGGVQIYYGDEVVRPLAGDLTNDPNQSTRSDYQWTNQNTTVLAHWQKLGQFRKDNPAVGAGYQTDLGDYTYGRSWENNDVVIKINASGSTSVNVSGFFANGETVRNAYNGETGVVSGGAVTFTAENGVILIERP